MRDITKYPRKFKIIRESDPKIRRKQLSQLKRDPYTNAELRGFLRDLFDNDIRYNLNTAQLKKEYGKHKLYKLLRQSMQAGYIQRKAILTPYNNHQGYRKDYHYLLAEMPIFRSNFASSLIEKKEVLECPHFECTLKWDSKEVKIKEKKEKKKKQVSIPKSKNALPNGDKPPNPPLSLFSRDKVKIKMQLYHGLVEEYTEPIVSMAIDRMNVYMADTGKYQKYECHGAKLKHWLEKDAEQYRSKLEKQKQEAEQKHREQKQREEYDRWMQQQEVIREERERQADDESERLRRRVQQNMPILQKYQRMYPNYISYDEFGLKHNGVYRFMGNVEIMSMSAENLEHDLVTRISEYEKKLELESKEAEKRTEMAVESNKDGQVVCVVKKMETQSKIGHSVLNQTHAIQKSPRNIGYQAQMDQNRWKNQLTSVLKSYGTYPMRS